MLKLQVTDTEGNSKILDFEDFPVRIGREDDSEIVTDDSKTSRRHAAIELDDGQLYLCDKGSSNGSFLNSLRIERDEINPGDRIRLGSTRIEIVELDGREAPPAPSAPDTSSPSEEEAAPAETGKGGAEEVEGPAEEGVKEETARSRDLAASMARRRMSTVLGPVIVLLLLGLGAYWYLDKQINAKKPVVQLSAADLRHARALEQVRKFTWESGHIESVTPDFLNRIEDAKIKYSNVEFRQGETTFDDLDRILRERRKMDVNNRLYVLISQKDDCLRNNEWATLFAVVDRQGTEIIEMSPRAEKKIKLLRESCIKAAEEEFTDLANHADYLEGLGQEGEALDTIAFARQSFRGTEYATRFDKILVETRERISRRREKKKELFAQRRRQLLGNNPAAVKVEEKPLSPAERLAAMLESSLSAFELAGSADEIDPPRLVALAAQKLAGKDLLLAARFAFNSRLTKEAGGLILKYLGKENEEECSADGAAARLLADSRGLEKVPEGGFTYARGHGWEDAGDKTQRLALVESRKILRKFSLVRSEKKLDGYFEQLVAVMSRPGLPSEGKELIRTDAIAHLGKLREKTSRGLERQVKHTAFARLKKARQELDKRRVEAITVIYDTKIYLPESHPDWKEGDEVNGQKEVDAAVERVRELWNNAATFAISLDKSTNAMSELIKAIEEKCYARLKYNPGEDEKGGLKDLRNNLNRKIDLKSFALNRADLDVYNYNRKVEAYNRSLVKEDIAETDKQHAVVVNDYREMMGRRRLFLDERLCRATRKHSMVCDAAGRIWHNGSDGSPTSRARAEGFPKGVGENIARGYSNPVNTWERGWYRASDHHRNGLGERWSCLGYGYAGKTGTQNFAAIEVPFK